MLICYQCNHTSYTCRFYKFPMGVTERKKWIKYLLKKDPPPGVPEYLCLCHFVNGNKKQIIDMNKVPPFKVSNLIKSTSSAICTSTLDTNLELHTETHTSENILKHTNTISEKKYTTIVSLPLHTNKHTDDKKYTSKVKQELHNGIKLFECNLCNKKCLTKYLLKLHRSTHNECKWIECKECGEKYNSITALKKHLETHTGGNLFYKCNICIKKYKTLNYLNLHKKHIHPVTAIKHYLQLQTKSDNTKDYIKSIFNNIKKENTTESLVTCIKLELGAENEMYVKNEELSMDCVEHSIKLLSEEEVDYKTERLSTENEEIKTYKDFLHVDIKCEKFSSEDNNNY